MLPTSRASSPLALPLDQAGDIEPRRIERLQDVVARRRQEARLGDVGLLGLGLGAASAVLSRVSSSVRSRTRRSSVSLARSSASAASTLGVMSVKVVTMPPSGMGLARTSMTQAALGEPLEERLVLGDVAREPVAHQRVDRRRGRARRARR